MCCQKRETGMSKSSEKKICAICGADGRCVGFAAICCKSCSVFYRRSYKLRSVLKCKREGNCDLRHELRNMCRACRLQSCRRLDLRMVGKNLIVQSNGYPLDDMEDGDEPSTSTNSPPKSSDSVPDEPTMQNNLISMQYNLPIMNELANQNMGNLLELKRIVEAFVCFENKQRIISSVHQNKQIQAFESDYINKRLQYTMETATLQLFGQMVENLLSEYNFSDDEKKVILQNIPIQLSTAHKAELTNRVFPEYGDSRIAFFIGYHLDLNKLENFLDNLEEFERMKKIAWPLIHKRWTVAERCRELRPTTIEWCCFMGVLLFEELTRIVPKNEAIAKRQNVLYSEYFQYLLSIYNQDQGIAASRIVKVLSFVHEINLIREAHDEMYTLANIFISEYNNTAWTLKPVVDPSINLKE